jgi:hypothetical protein
VAGRQTPHTHQNHADEQLLVLANGTHTSVANHTNRQTGSQGAQAARQTSTQVREAGEGRVVSTISIRRRHCHNSAPHATTTNLRTIHIEKEEG